MNTYGIDYFMSIFGYHRINTYFQPCKSCIIRKGFIECDRESYEWIK